MTITVVRQYMRLLDSVLKEKGLANAPERVLNVNETGNTAYTSCSSKSVRWNWEQEGSPAGAVREG